MQQIAWSTWVCVVWMFCVTEKVTSCKERSESAIIAQTLKWMCCTEFTDTPLARAAERPGSRQSCIETSPRQLPESLDKQKNLYGGGFLLVQIGSEMRCRQSQGHFLPPMHQLLWVPMTRTFLLFSPPCSIPSKPSQPQIQKNISNKYFCPSPLELLRCASF